MKRLFLVEFQKLWTNNGARNLTLIYFVLLALTASIAFAKISVGSSQVSLADQGVFDFPFIWHFNTYIADWFKLFLAIPVVTMIANEYTYGTLKQNLIDGLSKREFITSKFLMILALSVLSTLFVLIITLVLGFSHSGSTEMATVFSGTEYLLAYFIKLVGFLSFCLFVGIWVKRSAFTLGFLFIWYVVEAVASGLLHWVILPGSPIADSIIRLFPIEAMSNLIREPFTRIALVGNMQNVMAGKEIVKDYAVHLSTVAIVLAWIAGFITLSFQTLKKRDL